jgi:hypothetical protein
MDKKLIFGHFGYFHIEVTISVGCRDLTVSADSAGRRVSKNNNLILKKLLFSIKKFILKIILLF